ncbi:MAG: flavodoxin family protein [Mobilitalea sp.]
MKIGIVVHSSTGNTYSVAEKLRDKLLKSGHSVEIKKIEPVGGENPKNVDINKISFDPRPNVAGFDALVLCGPVRGFSMSPVLSAYLAKIDSLKDQKIDLFVTQFFPYPWMGGKNAISQMKKTCESKGATVGLIGIINWKNRKREKMIQELLDRFSKK